MRSGYRYYTVGTEKSLAYWAFEDGISGLDCEHRGSIFAGREPLVKLRKRVIVVGGGFGGISVVKALARAPVHVTLLDRSNHHLFQPLLYQVAMAGLGPNEIAAPIRGVLRHVDNARVLLAEVTGVDLEAKRIFTRECAPLEYDFLVLAPGAVNSYFGHDAWAHTAPGLKDLDDAI